MSNNSPKRLTGPAQVSNSAATKYTVPASTKTILRHIHVSNPTGADIDFTMSIGADAAATRIFDAYPVPANGVLDLWVYIPLTATEIIQAFASTNNDLTLTLSGDERVL